MDSFKPVAFIALLFCLIPPLTVFSQTGGPTVSLNFTDAPLETVLKEIRRQVKADYYGDASWKHKASHVTINVKEMPLQEALDICFKDQEGIYYVISENIITILDRKPKSILIHGWVRTATGDPIPNATIEALGGAGRRVLAQSRENGEFTINLTVQDSVLIVSSVNYESRRARLEGTENVNIELTEKVSQLNDVVVGSNGIQGVRKERTTGSLDVVSKELLGRRVSTNVMDRIDGITSSVIFTKNAVLGTNQATISIRGRSTINGNPEPLVVIDNFPYSGDISNINPEDVENITILKDAAAASIWGVFSGNGVIVITTKKGKYNQKPKWGFNTSATYIQKPDLYYQPILNSSDYIDVEQMLFQRNFYQNTELSPQQPALSPAVEIMIKQRDGLISAAEATAQLNTLRGIDTRRDLSKYFYRHGLNTQYSLNYTGGTATNNYYLSAGFDRNWTTMTRNGYQRVTLNGTHTYSLVPKKLEMNTQFSFSHSITNSSNTGAFLPQPYLQLTDANGKAAEVANLYRISYVDSVGNHKLLPWDYRPLDELRNANQNTGLQDYRINFNLKYYIVKGLQAQVYYQYAHGASDERKLFSEQTFFTRNLINQYSQIDSAGVVHRPIPLGAILEENQSSYNANNVRGQLNFDRSFGTDHRVSVIAGSELRDVETINYSKRTYGYNETTKNGLDVIYTIAYPQYNTAFSANTIPKLDHEQDLSDRYLSMYINGGYTFKDRYTITGSARRDQSNIFGVDANKRQVPLWSTGLAWEINKEDFYRVGWLPRLKLRASGGFNGNVDRSVSAYTTVLVGYGVNIYGSPVASVNNPPNPDLRWERIGTLNFGVDFGAKDDRITGSLEYYIKSGRDLIGQIPLDPTTGNTTFTGNTANMVAHGVDLDLRINNRWGDVRWNSVVLANYVKDRVTSYGVRLGTVVNYLNPSTINPVPGKPLYSVYALKWEGLDPLTGSPRGQLNGKTSTDYSSIYNSTDLQNLYYKGAANPIVFGSWRNDLYWRQFGVSFNITYKFGYYFRRNSIVYNQLYSGVSKGSPDFDRRWLKPGDEQHTYVPSMIYPADQSRDNFYIYSEPLIEKGDHIRLQDLQLTYDLSRKTMARWHMQTMRFYCYVNNIGIIWRANHQGLDPDYYLITSIPNSRTIALGLKMEF